MLSTTFLDKTGDRAYAVIESQGVRHQQRLYFDTQTGLLYREEGITHTPLGDYPFDVVYDDYRDVGGANMPFRTTNRSPSDITRYEYSEITVNQPIDPSRFVKPAPGAAAK